LEYLESQKPPEVKKAEKLDYYGLQKALKKNNLSVRGSQRELLERYVASLRDPLAGKLRTKARGDREAFEQSRAASGSLDFNVLTKIACDSGNPSLIECLLLSNRVWLEATLRNPKIWSSKFHAMPDPLKLEQAQDKFVLSAAKVKAYPHSVVDKKGPYGHYFVHQYHAGRTFDRVMKDHGGMEGLLKRSRQRANRKKGALKGKVTRKRNRQELESERSARLETALQRLGLKRRGDSTLCEGYIEGKIECYWTADAVAEKMAQMKYLHEYTGGAYVRRVREDCDLIASVEGPFRGMRRVVGVRVQRDWDYPREWPWLKVKGESSASKITK